MPSSAKQEHHTESGHVTTILKLSSSCGGVHRYLSGEEEVTIEKRKNRKE